jgi:hypothetical protein
MIDPFYLPELVVCGYEQGGTTLVSEILRNNGWESGFECGVLMCRRPADFPDFQPYFRNVSKGWQIPAAQVRSLAGEDFAHFYAGLFRAAFPDAPQGTRFFDKTPIYMSALGAVLHRTPFMSRAIVITRDPRSIFVSWASRLVPDDQIEAHVNKSVDSYAKRYLSYFIGAAPYIENSNVHFVSFSDFVSKEHGILQRMGEFIGSKINFERENTSRFKNARGTGMEISEINKFENYLCESTQHAILEKCSLAAQFFLHASERLAFGDKWQRAQTRIHEVLDRHRLAAAGRDLNGTWFEPVGYLLRNPDVLAAGVDPIAHYCNNGIRERRSPL